MAGRPAPSSGSSVAVDSAMTHHLAFIARYAAGTRAAAPAGAAGRAPRPRGEGHRQVVGGSDSRPCTYRIRSAVIATSGPAANSQTSPRLLSATMAGTRIAGCTFRAGAITRSPIRPPAIRGRSRRSPGRRRAIRRERKEDQRRQEPEEGADVGDELRDAGEHRDRQRLRRRGNAEAAPTGGSRAMSATATASPVTTNPRMYAAATRSTIRTTASASGLIDGGDAGLQLAAALAATADRRTASRTAGR